MFTVREVLCTPSPPVICSFKVTEPTPGSAITVFAGGNSLMATPFTTRPMKADPAALLVAVLPLLVLLDRATAT